MENPLYHNVLRDAGIAVYIPEAAERDRINDIVYRELTKQLVTAEVRPGTNR
jgi:aspartate/glutamate racemase